MSIDATMTINAALYVTFMVFRSSIHHRRVRLQDKQISRYLSTRFTVSSIWAYQVPFFSQSRDANFIILKQAVQSRGQLQVKARQLQKSNQVTITYRELAPSRKNDSNNVSSLANNSGRKISHNLHSSIPQSERYINGLLIDVTFALAFRESAYKWHIVTSHFVSDFPRLLPRILLFIP